MKRLLISLVLISLLATTTVMVAIAQEPTEEPTVEVTSTEEPTAEPTDTDGDGVPDDTDQCPDTPEGTEVGEDGCAVEPTEEPALEPTEEPTAEPTEEPTEEPTVEPTEEPTLEPTEEPTVEPTEEPTLEPTEEPTVEPTATITPTVEITATATITPAMGAQGDIGAQAIPGSWTSEYIGIQNLGTNPLGANVQFDLYPQGSGTGTPAVPPFTIPVSGCVSLSASDFSVGNGAYAGLITSDEPVAAAVINTNYTGQLGDSYLGENAPSASKVLPIIYRGHASYYTKFHIQNASDSTQVVTVKTYPIGSSTPAPNPPPTFSILANSSRTIDFFADTNFDGPGGFCKGEGCYGYAVFEAEVGKTIAVVGQHDRDVVNGYISLYHTGFDVPPVGQGRDFATTTLFKGHASFNGAVGIINLGAVTTTVTLTYTVAGGTGAPVGTTVVQQLQVGPNRLDGWNMPGVAAFPNMTYGSGAIHSSDTDVVAYVTSVKYYFGSVGFSSPALNAASGTTRFAVPLAFKPSGSNEWNTGLGAYTVGAAATITTTWVRANSDPATNSYQFVSTVGANQVAGWNAAGLAALPAGFVGSVYVESSGPPIIGYTNITRYVYNFGAQMKAHQH